MTEPNFERDRYEGQMNVEERKSLYNLIMGVKPETVFEVGTCRGGGSTYYIASALRNIGKGLLYTSENKQEFYDYAITLYNGAPDMAGLKQYVSFHFGDSEKVFMPILPNVVKPMVVFLDGGASSIKMLYDFTMFRPYMPIGSFLACHDWDNGKTYILKYVLEKDTFDWQPIHEVLGFKVFKRIADVHAQNT